MERSKRSGKRGLVAEEVKHVGTCPETGRKLRVPLLLQLYLIL